MQDNMIYNFNFDLPLNINIDASQNTIGAELFQIMDNKKQIVSLFSKKLTGAELKYSIQKKELLCLIKVINKYDEWCSNRKIIIYEDNKSVVDCGNKLKLNTINNKLLQKMNLLLQEYLIVWNKIEGKNNIMADKLSRVQVIENINNNSNNNSNIKDIIKEIHNKRGHFSGETIFNHFIKEYNGEFNETEVKKIIQEVLINCSICKELIQENLYLFLLLIVQIHL